MKALGGPATRLLRQRIKDALLRREARSELGSCDTGSADSGAAGLGQFTPPGRLEEHGERCLEVIDRMATGVGYLGLGPGAGIQMYPAVPLLAKRSFHGPPFRGVAIAVGWRLPQWNDARQDAVDALWRGIGAQSLREGMQMFAGRKIPVELMTPEDRERFALRDGSTGRAKAIARDLVHAPKDERDARARRGAGSAPAHPNSGSNRIGGLILSSAIEVAGASLPAVAQDIGCSWQYVQKICAGERSLTVEHWERMSPVLQVEVLALLTRRLPRGCAITLGDRILEESGAARQRTFECVAAMASSLGREERAALARRLLADEDRQDG